DEIGLSVENEEADQDKVVLEADEDFEISLEDVSSSEDIDDFVIEIDDKKDIAYSGEMPRLNMDPMLFQIYYDESTNHLNVVKDLVARHESGEQHLEASNNLIRALHTLFGSARTAEIEAIAEICGAIEKYVVAREDAEDKVIPDNVAAIIAEVVANVDTMLDQLKSGRMPVPNKGLLDRINKAVQAELKQQLQKALPAHEASRKQDAGNKVTEELAPQKHVPEQQPKLEETIYSYSDVDDDLIDIFLEEAEELLEDCESTLSKLHDNEEDAASVNELQRHMHTLKGGARMATLVPVGDLTHVLESMVILLEEKKIKPSKAFFDVLHESLDTLNGMLQNVKTREPLKSVGNLIARIEAIMRGETPEQRIVERFDLEVDDLLGDDEDKVTEEDAVTSDEKQIKLEEADESVSVDISEAKEAPKRRQADREEDKPHWGERATDVNFKESQEQVRVRADLLNSLVNYAGEVNIHHARMGKQITDIGFNLKELNQTVIRLKEQLRKLEIETEIQIRSSYEKEVDDYDENFDPLEMDRYSTLQQLAKSLAETASDVDSIKDILSEIVSDSETLLLQESRISTDLQEGLMRTRMVRFGGMSTRLRRIVRQTSRELGKEVNVEIVGEEQEVDRTILDRVVAPIEHMLRNAVAHGIEMPKDRLVVGKPEAGLIKITVGRQGTDVIVKVEDDGSGINADAIRKKAIKQGLLYEDNELTDHDVLQFILKSGFSTAEQVTQVAGRGVGMDVVDSE
ncbi:MAG: Hpt domain-containing protein, partial [Gammaproteobacteria bacterium]|nr:Hpt domain-containing protein [Gammaproteobacteria bacterium]